ncbi:GntR family transcriptional regulator [Leucobacter sp. CSA2]|uniref:GntR family transcriptional regulator n=1 Tax=Leucobacter edaphi TaxID=2796472 RepID=A0A934UX41_9MICO|nr:GntR family transcriptional regulator [Leucobacter edaphi]MBK0420918.1 GntR family transcriptional regulator [Leucobacter edaphi]
MTQAELPAGVQSAADQVRHALRQRIIEGELPPGTRLVDATVADRYGVSRNTARDGLRLLEADRLAVSTRNVGYSVRELSVDDIRDLYTARRIVETGAVRSSAGASAHLLDEIEAAAELTERYLTEGEWRNVGTASLDFHRKLVALCGSASLDAFFTSTAAQLRLAFSVIEDEARFQLQWVARDREIAELVLGGARAEAQIALERYLDDSEVSVIDAVRAAERSRRRPPLSGPPSNPDPNIPDQGPEAPDSPTASEEMNA